MKDHLDNYQRWCAAEADGREDDADAAFQAVFQAAGAEQVVSPEFTARTMGAIAAAVDKDARRARRLRSAGLSAVVAAAAVVVYLGAGWAVALVSSAFIALLNLFVAAVVGTAAAFQSGAGLWGVLSSLGRATTAIATDTSVTVAMIAISALAIAGLAALQRLLGSDEESFQ